MYQKLKSYFFLLLPAVVLFSAGCKKGTFDINNTNPNVPSSVDPTLVLTSTLTTSAAIATGGNTEFLNYYMGYWAVSGDYIPAAGTVQYKINTDFFAGNWDATYILLKNYQSIENYYGTDIKGNYYNAIAKIMKAFHFQRLVDIYNNVPYTSALNAGTNNFPTYDNASVIYPKLVDLLDTAVIIINSASSATINPGSFDVMYGGAMAKWVTFARTLKLKILMNMTQTSGGPAYITSKLAGLTTASFIGANADATINPGYNNGASNQQNPLWQDIGSTTTGAPGGNNSYYRACAYGVNFYKNTNDPRLPLFYSPTSTGTYKGRPFGSTALEHNSDISGIGGPGKGLTTSATGLLKSYAQGAVILPSSESFFLQAEAIQRGYLAGSAASAYQNGVAESFRLLGVANYASAATTYTAQSGDNVNFASSSNPIKTIIIQKWAAMNTYDPLAAWDDWRRLGIPSDLPVSIYPGTTAAHIPYRLLYPTSEYNYNTANVNLQGTTIDPITAKIFWMP